MIFAVSEPPQYIVAPPTGGKMGDMGFVIRDEFQTLKITGQTALHKKSELVISGYHYGKKLRKKPRKGLYGQFSGHISH
jgi:hypothetical protein